MSDFSVEMVGDSPQDIENRITELGGSVPGETNDALLEVAEKVQKRLEDTSPVDTGEYQDSWYIHEVEEEEVWVLNEADHAQYVMLENSRMQGSDKADLPSVGILHNVKGVAREEKKNLNMGLSDAIQNVIDELEVK